MKRVSQVLAAGGSWRRFWWHYLLMVVAMMVGMALGPLVRVLFEFAGAAGVYARPDVHTLVMATNMTIGMSLWMWFRGHGWRPVVEMAAAMYVPFVVLFPLLWASLIDNSVLSAAGHVLMLLAMVGVMLLRPAEYMLPHAGHRHAGSRRAVAEPADE